MFTFGDLIDIVADRCENCKNLASPELMVDALCGLKEDYYLQDLLSISVQTQLSLTENFELLDLISERIIEIVLNFGFQCDHDDSVAQAPIFSDEWTFVKCPKKNSGKQISVSV